jgi:DNA-directed RNA polymerase specialized sigma24 family protein
MAMQVLAAPSGAFYRKHLLSEDAVAYALAKAWHTWIDSRGTTFASPRHLLNWLKQTAFWKMVERFRQEQRSRERSLLDSQVAELPDPAFARRSSHRWSKDAQQTVWTCLQRLPDPLRQVLEGYYYDRLTDRELALCLWGDSTPAAGQRIRRLRHKALTHLRRTLLQCGIES